MSSTTDPSTALRDILQSLNDYVNDYVTNSLHEFQDYLARPKVRHWLRIIVIVAGYIMVRPLIEQFFKWLYERQATKEEAELKKKREMENAQLEAVGLKKPKKDANSLRVRGEIASEEQSEKRNKTEEEATAEGKKGKGRKNATTATTTTDGSRSNESKEKDEYENSDQEDFAEKIRASGVLEWGRDARKRKQRQQQSVLEAEQQQQKMDEEKLMELLDWSDDEK